MMTAFRRCIARPEYTPEELPQIRKRVSYWLEKSWKQVASGGRV